MAVPQILGSIKKKTATAIKTAADVVGLLNQAQTMLMSKFDIQPSNNFEILLFPSPQPSTKGGFNNMISLTNIDADDTVMFRLHLQAIEIPFQQFEYEEAGDQYLGDSLVHQYSSTYNSKTNLTGYKGLRGIKHPDSISITFLENEIGTARTYIQNWFNLIYFPSEGVFNNNQLACRKDALVLLQGSLGLPSNIIYKIKGLKPMVIESINLTQENDEPLMLKVKFSVDTVYPNSLLF